MNRRYNLFPTAIAGASEKAMTVQKSRKKNIGIPYEKEKFQWIVPFSNYAV